MEVVYEACLKWGLMSGLTFFLIVVELFYGLGGFYAFIAGDTRSARVYGVCSAHGCARLSSQGYKPLVCI